MNEQTWHVASTGNHQGLIIDDQTGMNIAVAYDKADAPLIAAAPELLSALEGLLGLRGSLQDELMEDDCGKQAHRAAWDAINKAQGRD